MLAAYDAAPLNPDSRCNVRMVRPGLDGAQGADKVQISCIERAAEGSSVALFLFLKGLKAKPAGRVPPDAILLSGNKSMQKCLLLAEGISSAGCQ